MARSKHVEKGPKQTNQKWWAFKTFLLRNPHLTLLKCQGLDSVSLVNEIFVKIILERLWSCFLELNCLKLISYGGGFIYCWLLVYIITQIREYRPCHMSQWIINYMSHWIITTPVWDNTGRWLMLKLSISQETASFKVSEQLRYLELGGRC